MAYTEYTVNCNKTPDPVVKEYQHKLNYIRMKYSQPWEYLVEDGYYGPRTAAVVKQFQINRNITPASGILGPTTRQYIDQVEKEFYRIQTRGDVLTQGPVNKKKVGSKVNKVEISRDITVMVMQDGFVGYKKLDELFPLAFKKISKRSEGPQFVFSKNDAYHNTWGAKYKRFNLPDTVSNYLGAVAVMWQWLTVSQKVEEYNNTVSENGFSLARFSKFGGEIFSMCTGTLDTIAAFLPKLMGKIGYRAAATGAGATLGAGAALSTIGQCIGAFLLGWEVGKLIGEFPVGNGRCVQDIIDERINEAWNHPYRTLGLTNPGLALAIDGVKRLIDFNVNRVSNLRPLSPAEKLKLEEYLRQHPEARTFASPPIFP